MNDLFTYYLGRSLGLEDVESIGEQSLGVAAPWAQSQSHFWLMIACAVAAGLAILFYAKGQSRGKRGVRIGLALFRATVLVLLVLLLAEPSLKVTITSKPRPTLLLVIDGTDSMNIRDDYDQDERARLDAAVGRTAAGAETTEKLSRMQYVRAWLESEQKVLDELSQKFRLQVCTFDRPEGVRSLSLQRPGKTEIDPGFLAQQLTSEGQVTALGDVFRDLANRQSTSSLQGVLVFSDFAENGGTSPTGSAQAPVNRLAAKGVKFYTVGVGATEAVNLKVATLDVPPLMKKAERSPILVRLRQTGDGLDGRSAVVKVTAEPVDATLGATTIEVGQKTVLLPTTGPVEFSFVPEQTGRYNFIAEVVPFDDEVVTDDNRRVRPAEIRDDFLRLMAIEYEPTWEWRFIKEVFHRDKLVGMRGFRTFLRSADPQVRITNPLFLSTLTPQRSEFFKTDVIFLGDMPAASLSPEFCSMTKEFVTKFGGGLVVMAGPRFGPGELADTELASILPVVVTAGEQLREGEFQLQLTDEAAEHEFMKLGEEQGIDLRAWENLGTIPWFQPVARKHELATVLAEVSVGQDPTNPRAGGAARQPIIALRTFPSGGHVIYIAFNEMWRLRRRFGERYYTAFWGGMIKKLALSHALGAEKRFVPETDKSEYRLDETVTLSVDAYDEQYKPLTEEAVDGRELVGQLEVPSGTPGVPARTVALRIPFQEAGKFSVDIAADVPGTYRLRVTDPISGEMMTRTFEVTDVSNERRQAIRNVKVERDIWQTSDGKSYDLTTIANLPDEIDLTPRTETRPHVFSLGSTWAVLLLMSSLMLGEWTFRKLNHLA